MKVTVPHYYDFGSDTYLLASGRFGAEEWDQLRLDGSGMFSLPGDRQEWERQLDASERDETRGRAMAAWLAVLGAGSVVSYGVGSALAEGWVRRLIPDLDWTLTEIGPRTAERVQQLWPDGRVVVHDFVREQPLEGQVHLFHGVDTELNDDLWLEVFRRWAGRTLIFYPNYTLGPKVALGEAHFRAPWKRPIRTGWWRTKGRFDDLTSVSHRSKRLPAEGGMAWLLTPR